MTSKKPSLEATPDQAQSRRNRGKTVRRSLVEASEAQDAALLARELRTSQTQQELAVIVVVEFTGELRKRKQLTAAARLARTAAAVMAREEDLASQAVSTLDFDASRAEFEELARSAGATIAATLVQRRQRPDPSSLVGQGKLDEIVAVVASTNASLVLFDHDLTPSQLRNIEARLFLQPRACSSVSPLPHPMHDQWRSTERRRGLLSSVQALEVPWSPQAH